MGRTPGFQRNSKRMGADSTDGKPFLAKTFKMKDGGSDGWVSTVVYFLFYSRRGGCSLYHLWIYFIGVLLSVSGTLLLFSIITSYLVGGLASLNHYNLDQTRQQILQSCHSVVQKLISEIPFLWFLHKSPKRSFALDYLRLMNNHWYWAVLTLPLFIFVHDGHSLKYTRLWLDSKENVLRCSKLT